MKKVLLGTSALAGASLLAAGPATAGAPVMTFSGALGYEAILSDGDQPAAGTGLNFSANEQQSELVWDAHGSADNGLNYGAQLQWRALTDNKGEWDESWLEFTGGFGRLYVGSEDGATGQITTSGNTLQVGTWGNGGNNALRHVEFFDIDTRLGYYATTFGDSGDANKIGYITPDFSGFKAGISYAPNGTTGQEAGRDNNDPRDGHADNNFEVAAGWSGAFNDVTLGINGAYQIADDNSGTLGVSREDVKAYQIGGIVGFGGFQVAAAYLDNQDSTCVSNVSNCEAGDAYNVGASYGFGPGTVSVMWQTMENDLDGNGKNDEAKIWTAGAEYKIAEGLSTYLNGYWFDLQKDGGETAANKNDATVVILGTRVSF